MNTELYFPRSGRSYAQTSEKAFEDVVHKLSDIDITIIFKTEINLTEESMTQALRETTGGSEKIDLIVVADALDNDDPESAEKIASELGITGKLKRIEGTVGENKKSSDDTSSAKESSPAVGALKLEDDGSDDADEKTDETKKPGSEEKPQEDAQKKIVAYSTEYKNRLLILLPKEDAAGLDFSTILYTISKSIVHPKEKKAFWKRFIPCSGDTPFDVVRKVILMLAICTFIVSSCMLVNILVVEPAANDSTNESIRELLVSTDDEKEKKITKKPTDGSEGTLVDFSKLLKENKDTVGWITIPKTSIDYVVVRSGEDDPEYYLYRDFYGNSSKYGTVFMDYRSTLDSKNFILHGHHMQDGRMFANLKHYEDLSFYKSSPTFTFNTIYEKSDWEIISIFKTNTLDYQGDFFNYLRGDFQSDYDFLNFVYQVRERSIIDTPVKVNEHDTLVTLSTCAYDFEEFRFVVVARKVRDGENGKVSVKKAKKNPDPLYPDVWYNTYGGSKPEVTSFQDAFNNKKIDWYDGTKKSWSEKDDKELEKTLENGKKKAIKELEKYLKDKTYSEKNQKKIDKLLEDYKKQINEAKNASEINEIYKSALVSIRAVQTESQAEASKEASDKLQAEKDLENRKSSAKLELHNSVAGNSYRKTQMKEVEEIFDTYNKKIDKAKTIEDVDSITKEGISKLAKIKTSNELAKEASDKKAAEASKKAEESSKKAAEASRKAEQSREAEESRRAAEEEASRLAEESAEASRAAEQLVAARNDAILELGQYVDINDYDEEEQEEIKNILADYRVLINTADTEDDIYTYIEEAELQLSEIQTSEEKAPFADDESSEEEEEPAESEEEDAGE